MSGTSVRRERFLTELNWVGRGFRENVTTTQKTSKVQLFGFPKNIKNVCTLFGANLTKPNLFYLFIDLMFTSIKHVKINHQGQQHATNR